MIECLGCIFFPRVLHAANSNNSNNFYNMNTNGDWNNNNANNSNGVAPDFRIGYGDFSKSRTKSESK